MLEVEEKKRKHGSEFPIPRSVRSTAPEQRFTGTRHSRELRLMTPGQRTPYRARAKMRLPWVESCQNRDESVARAQKWPGSPPDRVDVPFVSRDKARPQTAITESRKSDRRLVARTMHLSFVLPKILPVGFKAAQTRQKVASVQEFFARLDPDFRASPFHCMARSLLPPLPLDPPQ